ncbi:leucine rich repeat domain-containing protein [Purpureocillium lavendulum]|uniref:Leucine rich repeat domain-containing protein n=1 Tax=Purpureocillium lavendulum TaxID=1247861 RepID=A0AB34G508_9HYPO|nr:leucine rich repeat domain-containing protein [Purpureocillium lavendulum]
MPPPSPPPSPPPPADAAADTPGLDALLLPATPTSALPHENLLVLHARQSAPTATVTVVSGGGDSSNGDGDGGGGSSATTLSGGAIAGIVIGSIAGFLLLVWIWRSCFNMGAPPGEDREAWYHDVEPKRSSSHRYHHHHSRSPHHYSSHPHHHHHHHHRRHSQSRRRGSSLSSGVSTPPPVVIKETARTQPVYVARGRDRVSRSRGRQY